MVGHRYAAAIVSMVIALGTDEGLRGEQRLELVTSQRERGPALYSRRVFSLSPLPARCSIKASI